MLRLFAVAVLAFTGIALADRPVAAGPAESGRRVFVLPLKGQIDKSLMIVFRRAFREVDRLHPDAIIIDLDTPGGGLMETEEILRWMHSVKIPVYAYVNPNAISAGAILSLGCDKIFMASAGRIGSALPIIMSPTGNGVIELPPKVEEKINSNMRSLVRSLAQEHGYRIEVAEAMVNPDPEREVVIGTRVICRKGEILNLTAIEAIEIIPPETRPVLAEAIVEDIPALLAQVGMPGAQQVRFETQPAERLARWIVLIGPLLFSLAVLALYIEFKTPGFGAPGIIGIVLLMIFFFGHYVAGLAGFEDIALVLVGLMLLGIEVFVLPGFGVVGVAGILLIVFGTILSMIPHLPKGPATLPGIAFDGRLFSAYLEAALIRFVISIFLTSIGVWAAIRILPRTSAYHRLVLSMELTKGAGYVSSDATKAEYVGREGVAMTDLRPAGTGIFGELRVDVVTSGDMIPKDARIRVIQVQGGRVVVEKC